MRRWHKIIRSTMCMNAALLWQHYILKYVNTCFVYIHYSSGFTYRYTLMCSLIHFKWTKSWKILFYLHNTTIASLSTTYKHIQNSCFYVAICISPRLLSQRHSSFPVTPRFVRGFVLNLFIPTSLHFSLKPVFYRVRWYFYVNLHSILYHNDDL